MSFARTLVKSEHEELRERIIKIEKCLAELEITTIKSIPQDSDEDRIVEMVALPGGVKYTYRPVGDKEDIIESIK